jgi:hypothetical protein
VNYYKSLLRGNGEVIVFDHTLQRYSFLTFPLTKVKNYNVPAIYVLLSTSAC